MKTSIVITITTVVFAALLVLKAFFKKDSSVPIAQVEEVQPTNLIGKGKIKLMPYKEALEASKQFIYNISKAVLERFSPAAKTTLIDLGKKLINAGVEYMHVVDMFTLSLQRQLAHKKSHASKKEQPRQRANHLIMAASIVRQAYKPRVDHGRELCTAHFIWSGAHKMYHCGLTLTYFIADSSFFQLAVVKSSMNCTAGI